MFILRRLLIIALALGGVGLMAGNWSQQWAGYFLIIGLFLIGAAVVLASEWWS